MRCPALRAVSALMFAAALEAQSSRDTPVGIRQLKAHQAVSVGSGVIVNATADGLVEMTIDSRNVYREYHPKEIQTLREFYEPEAVLAWVDSVTALLHWLEQSRDGETAPSRPTLGRQGGRRFIASAWHNSTRAIHLAWADCGWHVNSSSFDLSQTKPLLATFRLAAMDARAARPARVGSPPNADTYYQHAVGCPATPSPDNAVPLYPALRERERVPYQVLVQFIVNADGRVHLPSVAFPPSTDSRFADAVRAVLPQWRFTPATRRGLRVRQLTHVPIRFIPPLVLPANAACPATGAAGVLVRPITVDGSLPPGLPPTLFRRIGRALGESPVADSLAGKTVRFLYGRNGGVELLRERADGVDKPVPPEWTRALSIIPFSVGGLPNEFRDDAIEIEIEFTSRCDHVFAVPLRMGVVSFVPYYDGTVQVSNVDETGADYTIGEPVLRHDFIEPNELIQWMDTTGKLLAGIDTALWRSGAHAPGFVPNAPPLGYPFPNGLRLSLNGYGFMGGGVECEAGNALLEIMPQYFARAQKAAVYAAELAKKISNKASTMDGPFFEHELGCLPAQMRDNPQAAFPASATVRTSVEMLARFVVDSLGRVESTSIEFMPGTEEHFTGPAREAIAQWRFTAATRAGRRVRSIVHVPIVLRPSDADAAILARRPELLYPEDTIQRTVFYKPERPERPVDRPGAATTYADWAAALRAMQPYVDQARRTWPEARDRFVRGLPSGHEFFVTTRLHDTYGRYEQVFIRVEAIEGDQILGRIQSDILVVAGFRRGDAYRVREQDLVDWTVVRPDGSEEGNVVGRFLDSYWVRRR